MTATNTVYTSEGLYWLRSCAITNLYVCVYEHIYMYLYAHKYMTATNTQRVVCGNVSSNMASCAITNLYICFSTYI